MKSSTNVQHAALCQNTGDGQRRGVIKMRHGSKPVLIA